MSGIVGNVAGGVIGELLPGMMGGQTGQVPQMPQDAYLEEYLKAQEEYRDYMEQAAQNAQNAIQSGVDSAVAGLNNQKGTIQQAGDIANQAAQQTYMDVINPNGATAEQLAALGLRSSGLTESSVISAGNTLQSSINSNLQNVNNQLAQIDLAITQAKSQGNIAAAQALEQYYSQIASQMMNDANTILAYRQQQQAQQMQYQQWLYEMQQSAAQNAWNQQFQQQQAQWGQYNTESDRRLQNQMANRDTLLALMQYGYKPTEQDAANTGYTLAQLNAMYNSIKNAMRSGLYG